MFIFNQWYPDLSCIQYRLPKNFFIHYKLIGQQDQLYKLYATPDSDLTGDQITRRSQTGWLVFYNDDPIVWKVLEQLGTPTFRPLDRSWGVTEVGIFSHLVGDVFNDNRFKRTSPHRATVQNWYSWFRQTRPPDFSVLCFFHLNMSLRNRYHSVPGTKVTVSDKGRIEIRRILVISRFKNPLYRSPKS